MVLIEVRPFDDLVMEVPDDADSQKKRLDDEYEEECTTATDWRKITIAGIIWFLSAVENTVVGMSEWPYMSQIDEEATTTFFGFVTSSARTGHAVFAVLFTYWGYKTKESKNPLLVGRLIALVACVLYLGVEVLPEGRRYLMLLCYFLFGVGYSSTTVLRSYIAEVSHPLDRSRAYAVSTVAHLIAIVLGPIVQLIFAPIKYPGYNILEGKLRFHIYSAPIWFALFTNVLCIFLVGVVFKEPKHRFTEKSPEKIVDGGLFSRIRSVLHNSELPWSLILLCWFQKMISNLVIVALTTTASPMAMVAFGWDGQKTVTIMSIAQGTVGILSVILSAIYIFGKIGHYVSARFSFICSLVISMLLYILTYPWPLLSTPIAVYNETTRTGCNPVDYSWCNDQTTTPWIWFPIVVLVMGIGLPLAIISIDTIYSKILGNIDQNIMQGLLTLMEDLMLIIGPIYSAEMFTMSGQTWLWIINGIVTLGATLIWMGFYPRLAPYK